MHSAPIPVSVTLSNVLSCGWRTTFVLIFTLLPPPLFKMSAADALKILRLVADEFCDTTTSRFVALMGRYARARGGAVSSVDDAALRKDLSEVVTLYEGLLLQVYRDVYHPAMDIVDATHRASSHLGWVQGFAAQMEGLLQDLAVKESILSEIRRARDAPQLLLEISPDTVRIYTHALSVHPTIDPRSPAFRATEELIALSGH